VTADFVKAQARNPVLLSKLEISPSHAGLLLVVPTDLESYVAGVLAGEAAILRSSAAREAMAILARTWATRWRGRHQAEGFDFCSLTHCQAFRPSVLSELDSAFDAAVRETRGQILQFSGEAVDPYFSADCGGMTEAAGNVWPDRAQPYLVSIHDPYCAGSEHASWQRALPLEEAEKILRTDMRVPLGGLLTRITVAKTDSSGRAQVLLVEAGMGRQVDANEFRYAANRRFGWATLKSNLYTIDQRGGSLTFNGRGLGHGVGLCQAGAEQMGRMGYSAQQILAYYFAGTRVAPLPVTEADRAASSEHFEIVFPATQQAWVPQTLEALERLRRGLGARVAQTCFPRSAALTDFISPRVRVRTFETTTEFVRATGQPGWSAATNDGESIALQPLGLLKRKGILETTLRHELTHLVVHRMRVSRVPHWYEEGLVVYLTHQQIEPVRNELSLGRSLEDAISEPRSEAEMKAAYALALERVRKIAEQRGEAALWRILQDPSAKDLRRLVEQSPQSRQ
jgi:stage II sporulation protein D